MNGLSLFGGAGIGELVLKQIIPNYRTVGYVEWDTYCQEVIRARIKDGILDDAPIFNDIRIFNERFAEEYAGRVDWLSAGFPCQPFSVAGRQLGEADERNMWPATRDAISIIRPRYCLLENVPALLANEYIRTVFGDLAKIGYDCEWDIVSAASVGAPHLRKRVWILAYLGGEGGSRLEPGKYISQAGQGRMFSEKSLQQIADHPYQQTNRWPQPLLRRNMDGVAYRVDRLKALGNGWVPRVVKRILQVRRY